MERVVGIVGGSGLYEISGLENISELNIASPWGAPSAKLRSGTLNGVKVVFLSRHGAGHKKAPNDINYRANIDCLKRAGVTEILSISACGSLRENMHPGDFVLVDQFIDKTHTRPKSFFGDGVVAHVSMATPTCKRLSNDLSEVVESETISHHIGGTYITIEGPQFSTLAESKLYRSWGCDVIGMTNMPEAKLAREAQICYQTVAMITDYDCWHEAHFNVDVNTILNTMHSNVDKAKILINSYTKLISAEYNACPHGCHNALDSAIITSKNSINAQDLSKLDALLSEPVC